MTSYTRSFSSLNESDDVSSYSNEELFKMKPLETIFKEECSNLINGLENPNQVENHSAGQPNNDSNGKSVLNE